MENRLNLLCEAGIIDQDICRGMMQVVRQLDEQWHLPVFSEQGEIAITHMANALMRSRRGEVIEPLDEEFMAEITGSAHWDEIHQLHQVMMQEFDVTLHANEKGYLLANWYGLWGAAQQAV